MLSWIMMCVVILTLTFVCLPSCGGNRGEHHLDGDKSEIGTRVNAFEATFDGKPDAGGAARAKVIVSRYLGSRAKFYGLVEGRKPDEFVSSIVVFFDAREVEMPYLATCDLTWILYPSQVRLTDGGRKLEMSGGDGGVAYEVSFQFGRDGVIIRTVTIDDVGFSEVTKWKWQNENPKD